MSVTKGSKCPAVSGGDVEGPSTSELLKLKGVLPLASSYMLVKVLPLENKVHHFHFCPLLSTSSNFVSYLQLPTQRSVSIFLFISLDFT